MYKEAYHFNVERYIDPQRFEQIKRFAGTLPTPTLVMDLQLIEHKYTESPAASRKLRSFML